MNANGPQSQQLVGEGGLVTPEVESFPQTPSFGSSARWAMTVSVRQKTKFMSPVVLERCLSHLPKINEDSTSLHTSCVA